MTSEHDEQVALITWCKIFQVQIPELELIFAIPSGGHRRKSVAGKMKAEGVKPGLPDLFEPVPRRGYHGLWIEMKVKGGRVRNSQIWWHTILRDQGYLVKVCWSFDEARDLLLQYLGYEEDPNSPDGLRYRKYQNDRSLSP